MFDKKASPQVTKAMGNEAEDRALAHLQAGGLRLVELNYRVAHGPPRRAGEVDPILRNRDATLFFAEVRVRKNVTKGGAAASVIFTKRQRVVHAAQHDLLRYATLPPCRFDTVAIEGERIEWIRSAFDLSSSQ